MHGHRVGKVHGLNGCISTVVLVAGGALCGVPSALPAAEANPELLLTWPPAVEGARCQTTAGSCGQKLAQAPPAGDTPTRIVSDQIRKQGFPCDEPRQAQRDRKASRPNLTVWIMRCANATYRVTLIPDMAARVERLP